MPPKCPARSHELASTLSERGLPGCVDFGGAEVDLRDGVGELDDRAGHPRPTQLIIFPSIAPPDEELRESSPLIVWLSQHHSPAGQRSSPLRSLKRLIRVLQLCARTNDAHAGCRRGDENTDLVRVERVAMVCRCKADPRNRPHSSIRIDADSPAARFDCSGSDLPWPPFFRWM